MADLDPLRICIQDLIALREGKLSEDDYYEWQYPRQLEDGSWTSPYPDYHEPMERLWRAFAEAGYPPEPADYVAWMKDYPDPFDPAMIRTLDRSGLAMCLLAMHRGERFCDGRWAGLLGKGALLAAAERAVELGSSD